MPKIIKKIKKRKEEQPITFEMLETYKVIVNDKIVFEDPSRSICNSYIFRNGLQGVRPRML